MKRILPLLLIAFFLCPSLMAQWSDNPSLNLQVTSLPGEDVIPKVGFGPNGDYYIAYFSSESGNYNVRLQRYDSQGNRLWQENGLLISSHPSMSWLTDWDMAVDHENHAILSWQDIRQGGENNTVAYRISPEGEFVWGDDGIMLSNSLAFDVSPKVTVTAANNAVFAWQADDIIIIQKISPEGAKQWGDWGMILPMPVANVRYSWPQLLAVGEDEVIIKFFEDSGPTWAPTRHILAQRFDADGQPAWDEHTVVYNLGNIQAWHQILSFENDGNDGFYMAWHDFSMSGTAASARLQHINAQGAPVFIENGVLLSSRHDFNQFYPELASPQGDSDIYVYWNEVNGNQNQWGIYGQKVTAEGALLWGDQGKPIFEVSGQALLPQAALPIQDQVILVYEHFFNGLETSLRATRLDKNGEFVWSPQEVMISSVASSKVHLDVSGFDGSQWVFAWEDDRGASVDIYAQNMLHNGSLGAYQPEVYSLTITIEGNGTVEVEGEAYFEPVSFEEGGQVNLEALAAEGWLFEGWSGDLVSEDQQIMITMDGDKTITATFVEETVYYTLTLIAEPDEAGSVAGDGEFEAGEEVTITATPAGGYIFLKWTYSDGEAFGAEEEMTFTMPGNDLTLKATFQSTASVPVLAAGEVRVFPNPATTRFIVRSGSSIKEIAVFDIAGKVVADRQGINSSEETIDIGALRNGIYIVRVITSQGTRVQRLQVVRN